MSTILLVRHGETHWNRQKRIQGHGDSPLTLKGIEQAKAYGRTIPGLLGEDGDWKLVTSPLPRCVQTMAILCESAGLDFAQVTKDDRLKEISTGKFSGRLKSEMDPADLEGKGLNAWFFRCPGGETYAQIAARLSDWLENHRQGNWIVVSHGVSGRILRGVYAGSDPETALLEETPQDSVYRLSCGKVERIVCK